MSDREIRAEIEVPGTPEQVWEAIATGPGITSWFMPARVDEQEGGEIVHGHDAGFSSRGRVTAWEPPRRFVYEEGEAVGDAEHPIATEWLGETRAGGTCIVRLVMSGFGPGDDFEKARESFSAGWRTALNDLRLYLTHFAGQAAAPITASGMAAGRTRDEGWEQLTGALGMPPDAAPGDRVVANADGIALAGTVQE
ncbi:MAG TPA: SRPBCC domain-containing protein, partial [Solirubrobacteraceae bacterium]|nr:SRPBCC domain-containing protein [Solirubrobacteraceae bacterium]